MSHLSIQVRASQADNKSTISKQQVFWFPESRNRIVSIKLFFFSFCLHILKLVIPLSCLTHSKECPTSAVHTSIVLAFLVGLLYLLRHLMRVCRCLEHLSPAAPSSCLAALSGTFFIKIKCSFMKAVGS